MWHLTDRGKNSLQNEQTDWQCFHFLQILEVEQQSSRANDSRYDTAMLISAELDSRSKLSTRSSRAEPAMLPKPEKTKRNSTYASIHLSPQFASTMNLQPLGRTRDMSYVAKACAKSKSKTTHSGSAPFLEATDCFGCFGRRVR